MLERLFIKNFALVGSLELEFGKGLVLLTGETGAGKSLLIGALSSLLGARIDSEMILLRDEEAVVEGVFTGINDSFRQVLGSIGVTAEKSVVIRRKLEKKGRNSAFINGCAVSMNHLKELTPRLLEINGQHQNMRLLDESSHAGILDGAEEIKPFADAVAALSDKVKKIGSRYRLVLGKAGEIERRIETLKSEIDEISKISPRDDEDEDLKRRKGVLQNISRIMENLDSIQAALGREEPSALSLLKTVSKNAEELSAFQPRWTALVKEIEGARKTLAEVRDEAEKEASDVSFDPGELEKIEERLYELEKLKRKYGPRLEDVLARLADSGKELGELRSLPLDRELIKKDLDEAFGEYLSKADTLSRKRRSFAPLLSSRIAGALKPLALEKARFEIGFNPRIIADPQDATEQGLEDAYFLFSANEGEPLKPLSKIASGGEMSRTVLAILCSADNGGGPDTVVFDEIDSGIGGRPAEKVGSYLSGLAEGRQIICITHLPQIAAFADQHIKVEKRVSGGRTLVGASDLPDESSREDELARMLAGEKVTESANLHARELLKIAKSKKK